MFQKYATYAQYRQEILGWASKQNYSPRDVLFLYPWSASTPKPITPVVVVFDCPKLTVGSEWVNIFTSNHVRIFESKVNAQKFLRGGVPPTLQALILSQVRRIISDTVSGKESSCGVFEFPPEYQALLMEECTIDITAWSSGALRSSQVGEGPLKETLVSVARRVPYDYRFKSLKEDELSDVQLEVIIVPNLWLSLTVPDRNDGQVLTTVATRISEEGVVKGFFMSNLANSVAYRSSHQYIAELRKKAGLENFAPASIQLAATSAFVEARGRVLLLDGVIPAYEKTIDSHGIAQHIVNNVYPDGYLPIVQPVYASHEYKLDLLRISFCHLALREYMFLFGVDTFHQKTLLLRDYICKELRKFPNDWITRSYLAQSETFYKEEHQTFSKDFSRGSPIELFENARQGEIIGVLQALRAYMFSKNEAVRQEVIDVLKRIYVHWLKNPKQRDPVVTADLLPMLYHLQLKSEAFMYIDWLQELQNLDGSFFSGRGIKIKYVRGVSKIAESCASVLEAHHIAKKAIGWLSRMQYTEEATYHIPLEKREKFKNGFRHDHWNRDLWLDGSGHSLLAVARLECFQKHTAHLQTWLQ